MGRFQTKLSQFSFCKFCGHFVATFPLQIDFEPQGLKFLNLDRDGRLGRWVKIDESSKSLSFTRFGQRLRMVMLMETECQSAVGSCWSARE